MPHAFSVEVHHYLSEKIPLAREEEKIAVCNKNTAAQHSLQGQLLELETLRNYLTENFDLKTQKYY